MRNEKIIRASAKFKENLDKLYPHINGSRAKTEKLNEKLEELLYGTKKKRKP